VWLRVSQFDTCVDIGASSGFPYGIAWKFPTVGGPCSRVADARVWVWHFRCNIFEPAAHLVCQHAHQSADWTHTAHRQMHILWCTTTPVVPKWIRRYVGVNCVSVGSEAGLPAQRALAAVLATRHLTWHVQRPPNHHVPKSSCLQFDVGTVVCLPMSTWAMLAKSIPCCRYIIIPVV
jgi:hypothetical protein